MLADSKGYIGIFDCVLDRSRLKVFAEIWLDKFDQVEQVVPGKQSGILTIHIKKSEDILEDKAPQFRVTAGEDFSWIYLSMDKPVVETSGLPVEDNVMPLESLLDLPDLHEVVDQFDEKRIGELEREGLVL
ncbi:MAG: hypothetical protein AAGA18_00985 [Verrucomicrobiota bacterium]